MLAAVVLAACSSGSGGGSTGQLSLAVTDAPVDSALEVVVKFTKVELQPRDGDRITIEFDEVQEINLLDYQGEDAFWLFEAEEVPAGEYNWIRLYVERNNAADGPPASVFGTTSYVLFADNNLFFLAIPSGPQTGLKLVGGFTVVAGETTKLVIDIDLRRALVKPSSDIWADYYFLRPALRLVDHSEVGHLAGTVAVDNCEPAIYVYLGDNALPGDICEGNDCSEDVDRPLTTTLANYNELGQIWEYKIGFLPAGSYTAAVTCDALADDPDQDDEIEFIDQQNVEIFAGETTVADFPSE